MKKTIITTASAILLAGCTGQKATENTSKNCTSSCEVVDEMMTGAYSKEHEPSEEELEIFKSAYKGDIELTPCSVAEQVVAGMNYAFRCTDGKGNEYKVTIFVPLPCNQDTQKTEVTSVETLPR